MRLIIVERLNCFFAPVVEPPLAGSLWRMLGIVPNMALEFLIASIRRGQIQRFSNGRPEACVCDSDQCICIDDNWMANFIVNHPYS
jgi:hypothetical protein